MANLRVETFIEDMIQRLLALITLDIDLKLKKHHWNVNVFSLYMIMHNKEDAVDDIKKSFKNCTHKVISSVSHFTKMIDFQFWRPVSQ